MTGDAQACKFTVPCIPTKRRVRFAGGRTYTDDRTEAEMRMVQLAFMAARPGFFAPNGTPVGVRIETHGKLPRSAPKKMASRSATHRPDADNTSKIILDALNGLAWDDDAQVVELHVVKMPDVRIDEEYTEVEIWRIEDEEGIRGQEPVRRRAEGRVRRQGDGGGGGGGARPGCSGDHAGGAAGHGPGDGVRPRREAPW